MPVSSTPTTALASTLRAPKLRSSCDSCGVAKIKCNQKQPECGRCTMLGLTCVYGLSRKCGKAPRKRLCDDLDTSIGISCRKRKTHADENQSNHTIMSIWQPQNVNEPTPLKFSGLGTGLLPMSSEINDTLSTHDQNQLSSGLLDPILFDEWTEPENLGLLSTPKSPATETRPSASATQFMGSVNTNSIHRAPHSCPRESYEIFRDLICPSPYLHAPEAYEDTVSAQLDQVLHFTSNAIDRLTQLLNCSCAKSGHRAMVHASIVSRILIWYQQAAGWTYSGSRGLRSTALAFPPPSSGEASSSPWSPGAATGENRTVSLTLAQSTGFVVTPVPLSVGSFSVEDQNMQVAFRNQLVLSELKKTAQLIDLFSSQDSNDSCAGLYSYLGAWLRSEHSRIVNVLLSRISSINQALDS
jgi:aflatoxin regulatory protein/Zn(2)-Cys(6) binuclear cluster domain-containing protein